MSRKIKKNKQKNISTLRGGESYPVFCVKYLNTSNIKNCKDFKLLRDLPIRLHKLSELGWKKINNSQRHGFGMEKIPVDQIKPNLPSCITPEVKDLFAFRASGDNRVFVGIRTDNVFHILFIETSFGNIYEH